MNQIVFTPRAKQQSLAFVMVVMMIGLLAQLFMPAKPVFAAGNSVLNPQFDSGTASWFNYNSAPANATFSVDTASQLSGVNAAKMVISNAGTVDAQIQLFQDQAIASGHTYSISFMARAAAARTIKVGIVDTSGSPIYFSQVVNLTTSAQTFGPYVFNSTVTSSVSQLVFFMGGNASTVYVDNVQMVDGAVASNTPTATTSSIYQAEIATISGGVTVDADATGYNGTGFLNFPTSGGMAQLNGINGGTGGSKTLRIRYANGGTGARTGQLTINGTGQPITFGTTGAWNTWATQDVAISLNSGTGNTIVIQSTGQDLANIDQIEILSGGGGPTNTPSRTPTKTATPVPVGQQFFDDFTYNTSSDSSLTAWWEVRNQAATGPGPDSCTAGTDFLPGNITFIVDPNNSANKLLRLKANTNGTCAGTNQAEINTKAVKFFTGTYAALVRFTDTAFTGTLGNHMPNETFFTMSDYASTHGTNVYSENDISEYLPNGGWGTAVGNPVDWFTTWYNDGTDDQSYTKSPGSYAGWHTLVSTTSGGTVSYYVDGVLKYSTSGKYYPRSPMIMDFNLWFVGTLGTSTASVVEDVDWVYYAKNTVLTTAQVQSAVAAIKGGGTARTDNVTYP